MDGQQNEMYTKLSHGLCPLGPQIEALKQFQLRKNRRSSICLRKICLTAFFKNITYEYLVVILLLLSSKMIFYIDVITFFYIVLLN